MSELLQFFKDMRDNGYGLAEIAAQLGTSAIAEPVAGFAAMYDPVNGAAAIREGMTYTPRTEAGQMYRQGAARTLGTIAQPAMPVIDAWQRGVDVAGKYSPVTGAALQTVPTALGALMGYKPAMQTGRQVSNSLGAMQGRMVANANAPRTLNAGYMGQRGAIGTQRPLTEFEQAHLTAQRNAALPVSQGGLGLPANNTAMDRARAMGFDVDNPVYHGTNWDVREFDLSRSGSSSGAEQYGTGVYTATNPTLASGYANPRMEGANVLPLVTRMANPISDQTVKKLTKAQIKKIIEQSPDLDEHLWNYGDVGYEGKNSVLNKAVNQTYDYQRETMLESLHPIANDFFSGDPIAFNNAAAKVLKKDGVIVDFPKTNEKFNIPWNSNQLRSRFAAFDPMKRESANLLATTAPLVPTTALGAYMYNENRKKSQGKQ